MATINNKSATTAVGNKVIQQNDKAFYQTDPSSWFVAKPYGFKFSFSDNSTHVCFLPISPSNLTISTRFATNMVPTLYGTVEEHSDVRYFDIVIEGTTGISPKYSGVVSFSGGFGASTGQGQSAFNTVSALNLGRESFAISKTIPLGGFFSKTLGALNQAKNKALDVIDGSNKPNESGIAPDSTGYVAFHTLYKMLLRYKKDAAGVSVTGGGGIAGAIGSLASAAGISQERKSHPLVFFNYKDGNQYNVVVRDFVMRRSADNPMLYYYSIVMRGYALKSTDGQIQVSQQQRLADLGLNGVQGSSLLGDIKNRANSAKSVIASAVGGINVLGR